MAEPSIPGQGRGLALQGLDPHVAMPPVGNEVMLPRTERPNEEVNTPKPSQEDPECYLL